ncbi:MAG: signal peptidase II [Alphaproteobacteria bacterium]|nr:signal peptidase II [Alphaproteobacteria bacterium]
MRNFLFLILSGLLILADQLSKWFVTEFLIRINLEITNNMTPLGFIEWYEKTPIPFPFVEINILPFFNIVMTWNKGVSFGMFNHSSVYGSLIFIILSLAISAGFIIWLFRTQDRVLMLGISMVIGGAIGNIIDRLHFGAVIDFLDFYIGNWHYPAFNVADSCIVLGVTLLMIYTLFFEKRLPQHSSNN